MSNKDGVQRWPGGTPANAPHASPTAAGGAPPPATDGHDARTAPPAPGHASHTGFAAVVHVQLVVRLLPQKEQPAAASRAAHRQWAYCESVGVPRRDPAEARSASGAYIRTPLARTSLRFWLGLRVHVAPPPPPHHAVAVHDRGAAYVSLHKTGHLLEALRASRPHGRQSPTY